MMQHNKNTNKVLITGAVLRENGFELGEGKYYGKATLLRLDLDSGYIEEILSLSDSNENTPDIHPNLEFTVGDFEEKKLWLSTDTEIRLYKYPELELLKIFSHPCFHNIHSLAVRNDCLYLTSTGLDMVIVLDKETGEIIEQINAEGKAIWHRFSSTIDYRKLYSTRPHDCHPNYIFWINDQPWVTRCTQEDAVCLSDMSQRIDISGPSKAISVHDGIVNDDKIYFTSVDGCIAIADIKSQVIIETIELYKLKGYGGIRGWCRGLYIKDDLFYLGFSRLRKTKAKGKLAWLSKFSSHLAPSKHSSVLVFDINNRVILRDYPIPENSIDAIYTILPEPNY